ncbi:unnamed protein product [Arctogadus glacialis]
MYARKRVDSILTQGLFEKQDLPQIWSWHQNGAAGQHGAQARPLTPGIAKPHPHPFTQFHLCVPPTSSLATRFSFTTGLMIKASRKHGAAISRLHRQLIGWAGLCTAAEPLGTVLQTAPSISLLNGKRKHC